MKRLLVLLLPFLTSCAAVDAYLMAPYDANEYRIATEIRQDANLYKAQCADAVISRQNAQQLAHKTQLFMLYSEHIPHNNDGYDAAKNLNAIAEGLVNQYAKADTVSQIFCRLKFEGVEQGANTIETVLGKRPRK